ncbi:MAG TPA: hypothetical protein PLL92_10400, partial [Alicycliphilus sp.]|nr:hypothetical protein [Alicycliphilus sp.]
MQQLVNALGQRWPMHLGQIEVTAHIEQGALFDGLALPGAVHQAVGDIGLAGDAVAGLGAANEHAGDVARQAGQKITTRKILWHYKSPAAPQLNVDKDLRRVGNQNQRESDKVGPIQSRKLEKLKATNPDGDTFRAVAMEWFAKQEPQWSEGHALRALRQLERNLFPWIAPRRMVDIEPVELLATLRK